MRYQILALSLVTLTACTAPTVDTSTSSATTTAAPTSQTPPACNPSALPFGGGNGSVDAPNLICSAAQLQNLAVAPYNGQHARLEADVGAQSVTNLGDFAGSLDGNGHVLGGFHATTAANGAGCGLFATLSGTVTNLTLQFMTINCPGFAAGALAAIVGLTGVVDNVAVHDSAVTGSQAVGGLVGEVDGSVTRAYSWANTITSTFGAGGLAGHVTTGATLSGNSASGSYSAAAETGFVVGILQGTVTCINAPGRAWSAAHSIGFTSAGTNNGCP